MNKRRKRKKYFFKYDYLPCQHAGMGSKIIIIIALLELLEL